MSTQKLIMYRHLISYEIKCHFFITITNRARRNKMIVMYLRTFIIKILFDILSKLLPLWNEGRHSTTDISLIKLYIK